MKNNKNSSFLSVSFLLPLLLIACNSEENNTAAQTQIPSDPAPKVQLTHTAEQLPKEISTRQTNATEEKAALNEVETQAIETPLPEGRLTGIIDTGEAKQAVVHTTDQRILYLQEQQQWDGWNVAKIEAQQVVLEREGKQHTITMKTMNAPELSEMAKKRQELVNQHLTQVNQNLDTEAVGNEATLKLSEEERELVNSRLLQTRSE